MIRMVIRKDRIGALREKKGKVKTFKRGRSIHEDPWQMAFETIGNARRGLVTSFKRDSLENALQMDADVLTRNGAEIVM